MSDTSLLDVAKFNLEAFKTVNELRIKYLDAVANYNLKMMEVLEKRIKVETDAFKLAMMRDAYNDFTIARRELRTEKRGIENRIDRDNIALQRLSYLGEGEIISSYRCRVAWRGFWYLVSRSPVATVVELQKIKCKASDRKGKYFFVPKYPDIVCPDAPKDIRISLLLMDWLRDRQAVPKLGSPTMERLAELLFVISEGAENSVLALKTELKAVKKDMDKLLRANWERLKIAEMKPKETSK